MISHVTYYLSFQCSVFVLNFSLVQVAIVGHQQQLRTNLLLYIVCLNKIFFSENLAYCVVAFQLQKQQVMIALFLPENSSEVHRLTLAIVIIHSVQYSLVSQSCLTLCDPMNHSMLGLTVHHQLQQSTHTQVH